MRAFLLDGRPASPATTSCSGDRLHLISPMRRLRRPARARSPRLRRLAAEVARPAQPGGRPLPGLAGRAGRRRRDGRDAARGARRRTAALRPVRRVTVTVCTPRRRRSSSSPSGRRDDGPGRGAGHPRHAPADRSAAGPVAAEELQRHPAAVGRGHLPVPSGRPGQPGRRATHRDGRGPRRRRRCATRTARSSASRPPSGCWPPAWTASGGCRPQRGGKRRLDNNRVFLHVWPPIEVPLSELAAFARTSAPLTRRAPGSTRSACWPGCRSSRTRRRATWRCASPTSPAPASASRSPTRRPSRWRPLDEYTQKVLQLAGPRHRLPVRDRAAADRAAAASFIEHDLDADGPARCRSTGRPGRTRPASSPAW